MSQYMKVTRWFKYYTMMKQTTIVYIHTCISIYSPLPSLLQSDTKSCIHILQCTFHIPHPISLRLYTEYISCELLSYYRCYWYCYCYRLSEKEVRVILCLLYHTISILYYTYTILYYTYTYTLHNIKNKNTYKRNIGFLYVTVTCMYILLSSIFSSMREVGEVV